MLKYNPEERISWGKLYNHSIFKKYENDFD